MLKSNDTSATSLRFIPPKEDIQYRYASYGAGQMKVHASIGSAKQSLRNRCGPGSYTKDKGWKEGFILEAVHGEWFILHHVQAGTEDNNLPWVKAYYCNTWGSLDRIDGMNEWSLKYHRDKESAIVYQTTPMTKDEYADWRLQVELERRGIVD